MAKRYSSGNYYKHGPFRTVEELQAYTRIDPDTSVFIQGYGYVPVGRKYIKPGRQYLNIGGKIDFQSAKIALEHVKSGQAGTSYEQRLNENEQRFLEVQKIYLWEHK